MNDLVNPKKLKQYLKTFNELHNLHAKQNENLRKLVENHVVVAQYQLDCRGLAEYEGVPPGPG